MFERLDDPLGVPQRPDRLAVATARGRRRRQRRRLAGGALAAISVVVVAGAVLADDDDRRRLDVAADRGSPDADAGADVEPCVPITTVPGTPTIPSAECIPLPVVTSAPRSSGSVPRPGTSSTPSGTFSTTPPITGTTAPSPALTAALQQDFDSGVSGHATASREGAVTWRITVEVGEVTPGGRYSVLVGRPQPDQGTPFPTACSFVAGQDRSGGCTGTVEVYEDGEPTTVSVMGPDGRAVAQGRFVR